jgi:hypothetical protein
MWKARFEVTQTDTSWQINFFGWHTSLGEMLFLTAITLISTLLVALLVALLALLVGPSRRWLSRTWNFCGDKISSSSD